MGTPRDKIIGGILLALVGIIVANVTPILALLFLLGVWIAAVGVYEKIKHRSGRAPQPPG